MQISVLLDRSRPDSLTTQMVDQIRDAIRCARIAPGSRLPSSRRLSEQLAISRNTVMRAYDLLLMEGIVESRPASGIYVAEQQPRPAAVAAPALAAGDQMLQPRMPMPLRPRTVQAPTHANRNRLLFDFFPGRPSADLFPLKTWRRLLQANLSHGGAAGLTQYGEPAGLPALRTAIANHLAAARGIMADPSRIVIVSGIQEGLTIAARLFLTRGALSVVEDPCYLGAAKAFEAADAEVISVAVDQDGLNPELLPQRTASLLYMTPSHQYPTGATLSAARRTEIVAWARRHGCYIIEDDYDCDIRYLGSHLMPLAALAPDCTIYMGTFSKSLGAGLRLSYMVVPERIAEAFCNEKSLINSGNPWLEQAALADFMHSGSYAAHLLRVRSHYKDNRDCLVAAMRRNFGDVADRWRYRRPACAVAPPAGHPGRRNGRNARAARAGWRLFIRLPRGSAFSGGRRSPRGPSSSAMPRCRRSRSKRASRGCRTPSMTRSMIRQRTWRHFSPTSPSRPPAAPSSRQQLAPRYRQQPALRSRSAPRASSAGNFTRQGSAPMPVLKNIYRYPIKGLSAQPLTRVDICRPKNRSRSIASLRWCGRARRTTSVSRDGAKKACS